MDKGLEQHFAAQLRPESELILQTLSVSFGELYLPAVRSLYGLTAKGQMVVWDGGPYTFNATSMDEPGEYMRAMVVRRQHVDNQGNTGQLQCKITMSNAYHARAWYMPDIDEGYAPGKDYVIGGVVYDLAQLSMEQIQPEAVKEMFRHHLLVDVSDALTSFEVQMRGR